MPKRLDPRSIRFTQDSVHETFNDGRHLDDTLKELKDGKTSVESIPRITVVLKDEMYFSPNNRRLWVFREYAKFLENKKNEVLQVPVRFGTSKMLNSCEMTTTNEGETATVQPKGSNNYQRNIKTVRLLDVRYSTSTLDRFSKSGGHYQRSTIYDELERFSSNITETKQLPVLKVVKRKGELYALDNLQLWLMKQWSHTEFEGPDVKDKTLSADAYTSNEDASYGSGNESQHDLQGVEDTVNNLDSNHQNVSPRSRNKDETIETLIYQRKIHDGYQGVESETNELDSDTKLQRQVVKDNGTLELKLKGRHEEQKSHVVETECLKHNDILNGGENVLVELRPYTELPETFATTGGGHSIQIVWNDPKKFEWKKYMPLTRQKASQERKDLLKYCQCHENHSKRRPSRR